MNFFLYLLKIYFENKMVIVENYSVIQKKVWFGLFCSGLKNISQNFGNVMPGLGWEYQGSCHMRLPLHLDLCPAGPGFSLVDSCPGSF